jgi:hypothetical protein
MWISPSKMSLEFQRRKSVLIGPKDAGAGTICLRYHPHLPFGLIGFIDPIGTEYPKPFAH